MNALFQWLASPGWTEIVKTLLHTLWQGAGAALLLGLVFRCSTKPVVRYRCALAALASVLLAGLFTWAVLNHSAGANQTGRFPADVNALLKPMEVGNVGEPSTVVVVNGGRNETAATTSRWTAWLALLWLVGAGSMLARAGVQAAGAERLRRSCSPLADPPMAAIITEARRAIGLTRRVSVVVTNQLTSPAVVGVLLPTLILPLTLITTLTPEQIRFVLLHELAHIRRGDYLANLFQMAVEALLFFNPAVWWISRQTRREREACCDAVAIELSGAPADYARTLLRVAESAVNPPLAAAPAFGTRREPSSLFDRVQRLLVPSYRPRLQLTWRAMLAALVLGGTLLMLSAAGTRITVAQILTPGSAGKRPIESGQNNRAKNLEVAQLLEPKLGTQNLQVPAVQVTSGMSTFDSATHIGTYSNNVVLKYGDTVITADAMTVDQDSGEIVAQGHARIQTGDKTSESESLHYNFKTGALQTPTSTVLNDPELHVRTYQLNLAGLRQRTGLTGTNTESEYEVAITNMLVAAGVDMRPPTGLFIHATRGLIMVRASDRELKIMEQLCRSLDGSPAANATSTSSAPANGASSEEQKVQANQLVQDGQLLYELDKFDAAKDKFKQVLVLDPGNPEARYILNLIEKQPAASSAQTPTTSGSGSAGVSSTNLHVRAYKLDPETFLANLRNHTGLAQNSSEPDYQQTLIKLFTGAGVNWPPANGVYFDNHQGTLLVRASSADLDFIDAIVTLLNRAQINIKVKFISVSGSGGPSEVLKLLSANGVSTRYLERFSASATQSDGSWLTSVLTNSQYRSVLRALEETHGSDLLNDASVTTLSGRQCQIQVVNLESAVTNINPQTLAPQVSQMPPGPTLDIIPTVKPDGRTIEMTLTPTLPEMLGYDVLTSVSINGEPKSATVPMFFRVHHTTARLAVSDGQTAMFTFLPDERGNNGGSTDKEDKVILVIVSPTIIDAAGNRVHPEGDSPAVRDSTSAGARR